MDPSGSVSSTSLGLQHEIVFPIAKAPLTTSDFKGVREILTSGFVKGLDSGSEQNTPRLLHSSDDGTPHSSELSFRPWAQPLSGQSSVSNSCCPSPGVPSRLYNKGTQPAAAAAAPTPRCNGSAAVAVSSDNQHVPDKKDQASNAQPVPALKRDQPSSAPDQVAADVADEPPAKRPKKARKPGPEDHLPWTERKIRRAKRAARSELSVSRGEW